ncbi:imidazolonepropionase [bacterium]|nr:MAG: imidazolonepropionase [bacterium]
MKIDLLITNAKQIVFFENDQLRTIENGSLACSSGVITWFGPAEAKPEEFEPVETLKASDCIVLPGLIDSHTHTVFAGSREDEFELKLKGATYQEIATRGGGIKNTMRATRKATRDELTAIGLERLRNAIAFGITTIEIKSGYGLSFDDEIKILEVIRSLRSLVPIDIASTFLGAHTLPPEFFENRQDYIGLICEKMIPYIAENKLAEFCDAFCEANVFSIDETRRVFETAKHHGLKLKLHADQLTNSGGAELCAEMGAVSADHLETISERGIDALAKSNVVAGLLPGCSFFLRMQYPPALKMIEAGIPIALATDFNPGSCMTQNLQMIMSIACTQMRMSPAEVVRAVTLHAARALERNDIGNIKTGMKADFALFRAPNYQFIPYNFAQNHIRHVVKNGKIIFNA